MRIKWPWQVAVRQAEAHRDEALSALAECNALAAECKALHSKALQCALAAGEAAGVARAGGVGDRGRGGVDEDLETLDTHRDYWR